MLTTFNLGQLHTHTYTYTFRTQAKTARVMILIVIVQLSKSNQKITVFKTTTLSFCDYGIVFILKHDKTVTDSINQSH